MSARAPFEDTLARLTAIFEQRSIPYVDRALRSASFSVEWRRGGPDDPIPLLLRLRTPGGPEIDVVCATRAWEREIIGRAVRLRLPPALEIPVVAVEDLIILKLLAGGPGDLADVTDLLERAGPLPELEKRAAARGVLELLRQVRAATGH